MKSFLGYLLLCVLGLVFALPFLWMVSTAFKQPWQIYLIPPQWIPSPPVVDNFIKGWTSAPFNKFILNTVIITSLATLGAVMSAALVAYGFARFRAPSSSFLFAVLVSTMMLPSQITTIPTYILFSRLGWLDSFKPLIVPSWFGGGAYNIFLLRQFFKTVPRDLDDAARIDGCSSLDIFVRIMLPLAKPALATVSVFSIVYHWNDFFNPLIYLDSDVKYTLAIGLQYFKSAQGDTKLHLMMAVALIAVLPILVFFFLGQKYFVQGITVTGIKG
ncbi:MAG: carbohydrate ABC transporter permease [Firmicutes bacterium]|nr:carbohydrate ABC transporter permease [Bacillota bacterium]